MDIKVTAVVAMAENLCIGKNNDLPWYIPEDLKRFKALTLGKPVIMGRKTFQSIFERIGRPLPGRANIVISRSEFSHEGVDSFTDLQSAIEHAKTIAAAQGFDEIIIGGGAQIYKQAIDLCDILQVTIVHTDVDGDAFFPAIKTEEWDMTSNDNYGAIEGKHPSYSFQTLSRKA